MFLKHFTWQGPKPSMDRLHHLDVASIWRGVMVLFANRIADLLQEMVGKIETGTMFFHGCRSGLGVIGYIIMW